MSDHVLQIGMPFSGIDPVKGFMPQPGGLSLSGGTPGIGIQLTSNPERPRVASDGSHFLLKLFSLHVLFPFLCLTSRTWFYCCSRLDQPFLVILLGFPAADMLWLQLR